MPFLLLGVASALLLFGFPLFMFAFFGRHRLIVPAIITVCVSAVLVSLACAGLWQIGEAWAGSRMGLLVSELQLGHGIRHDEWFASAMSNEMRRWGADIKVHDVTLEVCLSSAYSLAPR